MKFQNISIIVLTLFFSCSQNKELEKEYKKSELITPSEKDSIIVNKYQSEKADTSGQCNFNQYLTDSTIPQLAKDIFLNKNFNSNDNTILSFLDSLHVRDSSSRLFYFKVVTNSYKKSDGYYSEELGYAGKEYVENNTKEFLRHFTGECKCSKNDLNDWAGIAMLEINLIAENEDKDILQKFIHTLESNCSDCSKEEKEILTEYIELLNQE